MRRKGMAIFLCFALFMSCVPAALADAEPSDLQGHWAGEPMSRWVSEGLISGYPDGTFKPDQVMTRAEFVKLMNTVFGLHIRDDHAFDDVRDSDWYAEPVAVA